MKDARPRPAHLTAENAAAFQAQSVVDAYHLRAPYPPELVDLLLDLSVSDVVLELGCGTGEIARTLAPRVSRIDAVDISQPMLARAREMPGGDHPSIVWIESSGEDFDYSSTYGLAVAGDSLHWMDWERVLPAIRRSLAPGAHLALVSAGEMSGLWQEEINTLISRYSVMQEFEPYEIVEELEARRLFRTLGETIVGDAPYERTVDAFIEAFHARAGFVRARMGPEGTRAFDEEVHCAVDPYATDGILQLSATAHVTWGEPLEG